MSVPKPLDLTKVFLRSVIQEGDVVVDATLGNGYDLVFLAEAVGETGKVYGFDVQQAALDSSRERASAAGVLERCELIHSGHEKMQSFIESPVAAVVFNLGYLPGADKDMTTSTDTTVEALNGAAFLLRAGGLLSVMCYVGHPGGMEEGDAVREWMTALSRHEWRVFEYKAVNAPNDPPFLIMAEKL